MRVLLASDSFDPAVGGVQRVVKDLATTLTVRGHHVEILAPWAPGLAERESMGELTVHRVRLGRPARRLRAFAGFLRRIGAARTAVRALFDEVRPDIVHLHFLQSPLAYLLPGPCADRGVPLVATAHGRDVVGAMVEADDLGRRAVQRVLAAARVVTAPSAATLDDARRLAPQPPSARYAVVPNALPLDMTDEIGRPPAPDGRGVVAVGELHPKKGFDVLIRAVATLPGVSLRIAGTGAQREDLLELAERLGLADRVELVGFLPRDRLPGFLRSAAVQAVPSRREPFGLVIVEGFACGVPVVASDVDGIPDVVGAGRAAVLVAPDDPEALARALRRVLDDPVRRSQMIDGGRSRAIQLSADVTVTAYEAVYRDAGAGAPG